MKRLSAVVLTLLLLLTFVACDNGTDTSKPQESSSQNESLNESNTSEDSRYTAKVPEGLDYEGKDFVILTTSSVPDDDPYTEFGYGDLEASVINDAVDARNLYVENLVNCVIKERLVERLRFECTDAIRNESFSGTADFKICGPVILESSVLAQEGYFYDLYSLSNLNNVSDPWWDSYFTENAELLGKLYFATGDIGFRTRDSLPAIYFNKSLIASYDLGDPYELVRQNKWTLDTINTWAQIFSEEVVVDGKIDYKDKFGVGGQLDNIWSCYYGSGELLCQVNSEGVPEISFLNERAVNVVDKITTLMQNKSCFVNANDYFDDGGGYNITPMEYINTAFAENRSLFMSSNLSALESLRDMKLDFGILPIPLYDENQESYHSLINPWGSTAFSIPYYLDEDEANNAAAVMNLLGAEGKNTVRPAYYEVCLKGQRSRDDESEEMLDIIVNTAGCDIGFIYNWADIIYRVLHDSVSNAPGTYVSNAEKYVTATNTGIQTTIDNFEAFE